MQMAAFLGHWELRGYGLWAVEERSSQKFIGRIGLLNPEGRAIVWSWRGLAHVRDGVRASRPKVRAAMSTRSMWSK